jgi:hypothetical protein
MNVAFNIPGQPVPKGRPKFARRGAHITARRAGEGDDGRRGGGLRYCGD